MQHFTGDIRTILRVLIAGTLFMLLSGLLISCSSKSSAPAATGSSSGDTSVAGNLLSGISSRLVTGGLSQTQANVIVTYANTRVNDGNAADARSLWKQALKKMHLKTTDREDIAIVTPLIIEGCLEALGQEETAVTTKAEKLLAIELVMEGLLESLDGQMDDLDADAQKALMSDITATAVGSVDLTGAETADLSDMVNGVTTSYMENLDMTGIDSAEMGDILNESIGGMIGSLDDSGIDPALLAELVNNISSEVVEGLGFLMDSEYFIMEDLGPMLQDSMRGIIGSLDDAGFNSTDASALMGDISYEAMTGLDSYSDYGMTTDDYPNFMLFMMEGMTESLGDAGLSTTEITDIIGDITEGAVGCLNEIGFDSSNMSDALGVITEGASAGLDSLELSPTEQEDAIKDFMAQSVGAMYYAGLTDEEASSLIQYLTGGAVVGLEDSGFFAEGLDYDNFLSSVTDGATQGLGYFGDEGLDPAYADNAISTLSVGAYDGLADTNIPEEDWDALKGSFEDGSTAGADILAEYIELSPDEIAAIYDSVAGAMNNPDAYYDPYAYVIAGQDMPDAGDLSAPTGVIATAATSGDGGEIIISWDPVDGAQFYNIFFSTETGVQMYSPVISDVTSPFIHSGLIPGQTYHYVVVAFDTNYMPGTASSEVSATSLGVGGAAVIASPANIVATSNATTITLSWDAVAGATGYRVYWNVGWGVSLYNAEIIENGTDLTYTHDSALVAAGAPIYYFVVAYDEAGISVPSEVVNGMATSPIFDAGNVPEGFDPEDLPPEEIAQ